MPSFFPIRGHRRRILFYIGVIASGITVFFMTGILFYPLPVSLCESQTGTLHILDQRQQSIAQIQPKCPQSAVGFDQISPYMIQVLQSLQRIDQTDQDLLIIPWNLEERLKEIFWKRAEIIDARDTREKSGISLWFEKLIIDLKLDLLFSEKKTITQYLHQAYFGRQLYGIENATQHYFQKHPQYLTLEESVTLGAILISPSFHDPYMNPDELNKTQHKLITLMHRKGMISEPEKLLALQHFSDSRTLPEDTPDTVLSLMPILEQERSKDQIYSEDLYLQTTFSSALQSEIQSLIQPYAGQLHLFAVDVQNREILSVISPDFQQMFTYFNPQRLALPFVYALGLTRGATPKTMTQDTATDILATYDLSYLPFDGAEIGSNQLITLRQAFFQGFIIPPIKILQMTGQKPFFELTHRFGMPRIFLKTERAEDETHQQGITNFFELTRAFTMIASGGDYLDLNWSRQLQHETTSWERFILQGWVNKFEDNPLFSKSYGSAIDPAPNYILTDLLSHSDSNRSLKHPYALIQADIPDNRTIIIGFTQHYLISLLITDTHLLRTEEMKEIQQLFHTAMQRIHPQQKFPAFSRPQNIEESLFCFPELNCYPELSIRGSPSIARLEENTTKLTARRPSKETKLIDEDFDFQDFILDPNLPPHQRTVLFYSHLEVTWFLDGEIIGRGKSVKWQMQEGEHVLTARIGFEFETRTFEVKSL